MYIVIIGVWYKCYVQVLFCGTIDNRHLHYTIDIYTILYLLLSLKKEGSLGAHVCVTISVWRSVNSWWILTFKVRCFRSNRRLLISSVIRWSVWWWIPGKGSAAQSSAIVLDHLIWSKWRFQSCPWPTSMRKVTGPLCWTITPGIQVNEAIGLLSRTITCCPGSSSLSLACWSCCCFCWACLWVTLLCTLGNSKSRRVRRQRPRNRVLGISPVVALGVVRYASRKFSKQCGTVSPSRWLAFIACLKVLMNCCSTAPFEEGW